jgi:hypothetical protein
MRKNKLFLIPLLLGLAIGAGLVIADEERGNVDELRFGTSVDAQGVVPAATAADHFLKDSAIHVTMQVREAAKGTKLLVSVMDRETDKLVWSSEQAVPGGRANMHFVIPSGAIPTGKYRAKVKLHDDAVAEHEFEIE